MSHDLSGTANDITLGFSYNPAGQITSSTRSNNGYAWTQHYTIDRLTSVDGLNRILGTSVGGAPVSSFGHDARGNLTGSTNGGATSMYSYDADNMLVCAGPSPLAGGSSGCGPDGASLRYDALGRLYEVTGPQGTTRFQYQGIILVAEYDGGNARLRRYVPGPGSDEYAWWYEGATIGPARWYHQDERGSVLALSNYAGEAIAINRYDEYGIPASTNLGRIGYTGQMWLPELNMWHYRARIYSPTLGRFLQTDPIGYGDGLNLYAYVGGDPVNFVDPLGLGKVPDIVVIGGRGRQNDAGNRGGPGAGFPSPFGGFGYSGNERNDRPGPQIPWVPAISEQLRNCAEQSDVLNNPRVRERLAQSLEGQARQRSEYGFAVAVLDNGSVLVSGVVTSGNSIRVNYDDAQSAVQSLHRQSPLVTSSTRIIFIHAHPSENGLSPGDVRFAHRLTARSYGIVETVAVSNRGVPYCTNNQ